MMTRSRLAIHALVSLAGCKNTLYKYIVGVEGGRGRGAYKIAVAKTMEMPIFRLKGICKDDIQKRGIIKIATSEMTLIIEEAQITLEISRQRPGVQGSQILRRGIQVQIEASVAAR